MTIATITAAIISFSIAVIVTPKIATVFKKHGITGVDIHKPKPVKIPEMCGIAIVLATITTMILLTVLIHSSSVNKLIAIISVGLIACAIGVRDDLKHIHPMMKPLLTAFAGFPIILLQVYTPRPMIPFIGATRLTMVYSLLVFVSVSVTANSVNMMDVFNGVMPATCGIISFSAMLVLLFLGRIVEASVAASLFGALTGFYLYNRYPARVFAGDTGSLFVGAILGALAVVGRLEIFMIIALMPHIMNAFYSLSSVGHLFERREIASRPIRIIGDGTLDASFDHQAPLTLARLILIHGPLDEQSVTKIMIVLTLVSSALAIITLFFVPGLR